MTVNVLGQPYEIIMKRYDEEEAFERRGIDGFESGFDHEIVVCDMHTHPLWKGDKEQTIQACHKQTLRHEIVHAFLDESGLADSAGRFDLAWSKNEEMVDWFAMQGPKIYKAWQEAGAL